jgi:hypothetical protein
VSETLAAAKLFPPESLLRIAAESRAFLRA